MAMESTIRILKEFHQTAKLEMYNRLVCVVGFFAVSFALYTIVVIIAQRGNFVLPWQLAWVEDVVFESLNFSVLAAVCVVCRPTEHSKLLSYVSQLPTFDPDDFADDVDGDDIEMSNYGYGNANFEKTNQKDINSNRIDRNIRNPKEDEEKKQKMRKRRDFFDGGDEFDADLHDEFDEKEQALEFEKMMRSNLQKMDMTKGNGQSKSSSVTYDDLPLAADDD